MIDMSSFSANELMKILEPMVVPFGEIEKNNILIQHAENDPLQAHRKYRAYTKGISVGSAILMAVLLVWFFDHVYIPNYSIVWFIALVIGAAIGSGALYNNVFIESKSKAERKERVNTVMTCRENIARIFPTIPNIDSIPSNYLYYDAIRSLYSYFRDGRASNWKEAVNLYEEESHRRRMEDLANLQAQAAMNAEIYAKAAANSVNNLNSQMRNLNSQVGSLNSQMEQVNYKLHM